VTLVVPCLYVQPANPGVLHLAVVDVTGRAVHVLVAMKRPHIGGGSAAAVWEVGVAWATWMVTAASWPR